MLIDPTYRSSCKDDYRKQKKNKEHAKPKKDFQQDSSLLHTVITHGRYRFTFYGICNGRRYFI